MVTEDIIDEVAQDLRLRVTTNSCSSGPGLTDGQQALAQSLMKLANMLQQAARGPFVNNAVPENENEMETHVA